MTLVPRTKQKNEILLQREDKIVSTEEKRITLAYEGLTEVPRNLFIDYGPILEILDLSHNLLTNVDFLEDFISLRTLILDHNHITSSVVFPYSPNLSTLWINHNFIDTLNPFIEQVSMACPNLDCLSLMGNQGAPSYLNGGTFYEYWQYRLFVVSMLPKLEYLDDRRVTQDEKSEANRLYGRTPYKSLSTKPQVYFSKVQKGLLYFEKSFSAWKSLWTQYDDNLESPPSLGIGDGIRVQDMGTIQADTSSSSSLSIQLPKQRNLVI